jgi:hypothetical protein
VAQWWELAIPAGATLLGGWTGAWWQSQSAARQRTWQLQDAAATRLFDERRKAYSDLGTAAFSLYAASAEYWQLAADPGAAGEHLDTSFTEFRAATDAFRTAIVAVELVGSDGQAQLARELEASYSGVHAGPVDYARADDIRNRFLDEARRELAPA